MPIAVWRSRPRSLLQAAVAARARARYRNMADGAQLFAAAAAGDAAAVKKLLLPPGGAADAWRSLNAAGRTAGEVALQHGHQACWDVLVEQGAENEIAARVAAAAAAGGDGGNGGNDDYLAQRLVYGEGGGVLLDAEGEAVMMG